MSNPQQNDTNPITLFAQTNFRNQQRRFGIKLDDRRRHMYVIGKTGMGKTTLLENMILSDIYAGHGCCYIDPHGDTAEKLLDFIPSWRINDVVYFNPADLEYPVGFNILETVNDEQKHLVGSGLMGVFKKIWPDVWSPRMEYILLNCVLALLDYPGATLLGINRLLVDRDYRQRVIEKIRDPIVKTFWVAEFSSWSEKYATEAIAPVQNKVGQFLSTSVVRNIVAQVKSTIVMRRIMDDQKIFIVNLSKGRIGEDNMRLLGGMVITKLQLAAMERVDMPEADRKDFFLYVDEFQNFAGPNFAGILSEARKYRLALILAHQYIEQLDETVRDAVFGNVGTIVTFRVGSPDALYMEKEFSPVFIPEDLASLPKFGIYLKLMVDGVSTDPFSALTLPPIAQRTGSTEKVVVVSRERYATTRSDIQEKVLKWSGMESGPVLPEEPPEGVVTGGEVSYPKIETEEEKDQIDEATGEAKAGEYLRFSPERLAAISKAAPAGAKKKDKPKFPHTCSRCGKVWEMPVQLDPTRPMYCAECLPIVREERKIGGKVVKAAVTGAKIDGIELMEVKEDAPMEKKKPSLHDAMRGIEDGGRVSTKKNAEPNRPRIVTRDQERVAEVALTEGGADDDEERSELLEAISEKRGVPIDTKKRVEPAQQVSAQPRIQSQSLSRPQFEPRPPVQSPAPQSRPQQPLISPAPRDEYRRNDASLSDRRMQESRIQGPRTESARPSPEPVTNRTEPGLPTYRYERQDDRQRPPISPSGSQRHESGRDSRGEGGRPESMRDDAHRRRHRNRHRELPEDRRRSSLEDRFERAISQSDPVSAPEAQQRPAESKEESSSATVFRSNSPRIVPADRDDDDDRPFGGIRVQPGQRVKFDS